MLIVGAKGFAKEVLEICHQNDMLDGLVFYDDINEDVPEELYGRFPVLTTLEQAKTYFEKIDNRFTVGIGNPLLREKLFLKFLSCGGRLISTISQKADIGSYNVKIGEGANILDGVKISNDVTIGIMPIIYYNSVITHDVILGNYVEISPSVNLLGRCKIGDFCKIGTNSVVFPDVEIGENTIIGAGTVVNKDLPANCTAVGVPVRIIEKKQKTN